MPKLDAKLILKQISDGKLSPVYWIYGPETFKIRELTDRLRKAVDTQSTAFQAGSTTFIGSSISAAYLVDEAQSMSLGGGTRFIIVRDADQMQNLELIKALFAQPAALSDLVSVVVLISNSLDQRKKFTKELVNNCAVVECEAVNEAERESWISYLSKQQGITLPAEAIARLSALEPWSLELIQNEITKFSLNPEMNVLGLGDGSEGADSIYLDALFERNAKKGMLVAQSVSSDPALNLPLLGLLSWNARHLALLIAESEAGSRTLKINPYAAQKLNRWKSKWPLRDAVKLQHALHDLDFATKQTPKLALGLWTELMLEFSQS